MHLCRLFFGEHTRSVFVPRIWLALLHKGKKGRNFNQDSLFLNTFCNCIQSLLLRTQEKVVRKHRMSFDPQELPRESGRGAYSQSPQCGVGSSHALAASDLPRRAVLVVPDRGIGTKWCIGYSSQGLLRAGKPFLCGFAGVVRRIYEKTVNIC